MTAGAVNKWLTNNDDDRTRNIYQGFRTEEFVQILRLPNSMSTEILNDLTFNFNKFLKFNSANLEDNTYYTIKNFEELPNQDKQDEIMKVMTEFNEKEGKPERGDPFKFFTSLCKFPMIPGSYGSRELLYKV